MTTQARGRAVLRQIGFLAGLSTLIASAAGYVWMQAPLRNAIALERELAENVGRIMTLDETLTMSAKLAASSKNPAYEQRYNAHVGELDELIKKTVGLTSDPAVDAAVRSTDDANRRLVEMETQSFELTHAGKHLQAVTLLESEQYRTQKAIYAAGMKRAFAELDSATSAKRAAVERWMTWIRVLALLSLGMVVGTWALDQRERRRRSASYAAELSATVELRTSELAERNRSMRLVLDSVQQGLVGVDLDGWMSSERSAVLDAWLGSVTGPLRLEDHVRAHDPQFADSLAIGLEQVRAEILPLELCLEQLPKQLVLGERTLRVGYETIASNGRISGLLVVLSDTTSELARERAEAEQRELVRVLQSVTHDRTGFLNFLEEANDIVERLLGLPREERETEVRLVHTLKGNAAQFGLILLSQTCHEIEERQCIDGALSAADRELLDIAWRTTRERIQRVVVDRSATHVEVERAQFDNVVSLVGRRIEHDRILAALVAWTLDPVQTRLSRLGEYALAIAERTGKPEPEIASDGQGLRLDGARWASFWSVCGHLVRNAVDHGLEPAAQRRALGKSERGRLELTAHRNGDAFVVRFSDDGAGIDWQRLADKATQLGLPVATEHDLTEALFADGVSSCDCASELSGRGVGMAAVRAEVRRRNGIIRVSSTRGAGTTIEIELPAAFEPASQLAARQPAESKHETSRQESACR